MSLADDDAAELQRRRLEEQVKTKVERDLFRYYRNLGSAVIAVLGVIGISIGWPALVERIDREIAEQIADRVDAPVEQARTAAEEAGKLAAITLAGIKTEQSRLNESLGRIGPKFDAFDVRYGAAAAEIDGLSERTGEMRQLVEFLRNQVQTEPVARSELVALESRLAEVVEQTRMLAEAVKALEPGAAAGVDRVQDALAEIATAQQGAVDQAQQKSAEPKSYSTVYVQFAGGRRQDIEAISEILRTGGWTVPGEERTGLAAGKREIRYFHASDHDGAKRLAADLEAALAARGVGGEAVKVRKLAADTFKTAPVAGILEVWLEI